MRDAPDNENKYANAFVHEREEMDLKRAIVLSALIAAMTVNAAGASAAGWIIAATTDYETGNTAVLNTETGVFNGNALGHSDQDITVVAYG